MSRYRVKERELGEVLREQLRGDGYVLLSKALAFVVGVDAALMYSELLSRRHYFMVRQGLDREGYFFNTVEDLYSGTSLSDYQQRRAVKVLEDRGLIEVKVKGVPPKRWFKIGEDVQVLLDILYEGQQKMWCGSSSEAVNERYVGR